MGLVCCKAKPKEQKLYTKIKATGDGADTSGKGAATGLRETHIVSLARVFNMFTYENNERMSGQPKRCSWETIIFMEDPQISSPDFVGRPLKFNLPNFLNKTDELCKTLKTLYDFKELIIIAHRKLFTLSKADGSVKVDEKLANVLKIFAEKNIQPRSVSLLFGSTDDLVNIFGNFVLGSPVTMLPHIMYFARDRVDQSSSKSATTAGKYSDKPGLAGSILGITTPEFEALVSNGYNGWLKDYSVHNTVIIAAESGSTVQDVKIGDLDFHLLKFKENREKTLSIIEKIVSDQVQSILVVHDGDRTCIGLNNFLSQIQPSLVKMLKSDVKEIRQYLNDLKETYTATSAETVIPSSVVASGDMNPETTALIPTNNNRDSRVKPLQPGSQLNGRSKDLFELMKKIRKNAGAEKYNKFNELLQTLLTNIENNSENQKYRKINTSNEKLKSTVFMNNDTRAVLGLCGFVSTDNIEYVNGLKGVDVKLISIDIKLAASEVARIT